MKERKHSNELKECSDYSSKDELLTDKPAMNTLKKTFSAMLSKIPVFARSHAYTSSISDNCSVMSKSSKAWDATSTIDRALFNRGSGKVRRSNNIGRANSTASVNIKNSGILSILLFDKSYLILHYLKVSQERKRSCIFHLKLVKVSLFLMMKK